MNRKLAILIVVLLLAGAVAIAIVKTRGGGKSADSGPADTAAPGAAAVPTAGDTPDRRAAGSKASDRSAQEVRDVDLVAKYGSPRTKLSRKVSENVVSLLDDAIEMGEMMSGFGGGRMRALGALRGTGIELTEEQQEKVAQLYADYQKREVEKSRSAIDAVRKDPSSLMELFLAGDALKRDEMGEDEYSLIQAAAGERLMGVINPLDRDNLRGGRPMDDEAFRSEFEAVLDEDQSELWAAKQAEQEAKQAAKEEDTPEEPASDIPEGNISNIPSMDLETLDKAVGSAKQMTSGIKQMMEGMGNLRDLQPKIEGTEGGEPE